MSTSSVQAVINGVKEVSQDPAVAKFMKQLVLLVGNWFSNQGYNIEVAEQKGDYLLNGNLGKQSAFFQLTNPEGGAPLRVVCEVRAFAHGEMVYAVLQVRQNGKGQNPWKTLDSSSVQVHYPSHPGEYKLRLLIQRLRALLNINEEVTQLEDTLLPPMLKAVMAEACASTLA